MDRLSVGSHAAYTNNPLNYARIPHEKYLKTWGKGTKEVLLLGMNPGPFGMAQNGVPFGDTAMVRDWLGISGKVTKPSSEHPRRPILGFDCARSEVSGSRLWGWAAKRFIQPQHFFDRFFVVNYCPLVFMDPAGRNLTPDKLPKEKQQALYAPCTVALISTIKKLKPDWVIGIGKFAEKRAKEALNQPELLEELSLKKIPQVGTILHPSPASPLANRGWAQAAESQLKALAIKI
ncbi:MAG: single-stranded DNA-binding protein [Polyangiaceae bacterium]|nr:single-stranded DNA-binding protein [Polyangiaceae bacterium]